ncbi:MAG: hypothetical protein ABIO65_07520 [Nitrospiria bacterium]
MKSSRRSAPGEWARCTARKTPDSTAPLFAGSLPRDLASLDVTPDGQRFLRVTAASPPIAVRQVLGWPERLGNGNRQPE